MINTDAKYIASFKDVEAFYYGKDPKWEVVIMGFMENGQGRKKVEEAFGCTWIEKCEKNGKSKRVEGLDLFEGYEPRLSCIYLTDAQHTEYHLSINHLIFSLLSL
jgi:hypothetical protein